MPRLVDCYPLREAGRKLVPDVIKHNGPVRGYLHILRERNRSIYPGEQEREPWLVYAAISSSPKNPDPSMLFLRSAREGQSTPEGVMIHGKESLAPTGPFWAQAW